MNYWNRSPLGRLLLLWVAGLLVANHLNHLVYWPPIIVLILAGLFILEILPLKVQRNGRLLQSIGYVLLPFVLSCWIVRETDERNHPQHYVHITDSVYNAAVRLTAPAEEKEKTIKLTVSLLWYAVNKQQKPTNGIMWLYINKTGCRKEQFGPGQLLYVRIKPSPITKPSLPGAFDVAAYAARHQIYATAYVPSSAWCFINQQSNGLAATHQRITQWLKNSLAEGIHNTQALGIAEALLFGNRTDIDNTTWQAYARSGIVHVIAISGMHLGLIYTSLLWLFSVLPGRRRTAIVLALVCLWGFAWITGMPASVMRAAWMFTFIGIGEWFNRSQQSINTLFASAWLILIIDPWQWYDVGFQLSYLAVLSLQFFYTPIHQKLAAWFPTIMRPVAQLMAATLAAQILTTPWMLYLFHQFPLWVLITNLIAVPWSTLLIYAELIWVFLHPWHAQLQLIGNLMSEAIMALNSMALWVSRQSHAVWQTAEWSLLDMLCFYAALVGAYLMISKKKPVYGLMLLWCLAGLSASTCYETYAAQQKKGCIVYYQKPGVAIQCYANGHQCLFVHTMPATFWRYQWQPTMAALYLDSNRSLPVQQYHREGFHALNTQGLTVVYTEKPWSLKKQQAVDVLVLGPTCKPGPWLTNWQAKVCVVCSYYNTRAYASSFQQLIALRQSGAWQGFTSP